MADDDIVEVPTDPEGEFDLDTEGNGDLEAVMQEALEAVEKVSRESKGKPETDDDVGEPLSRGEMAHLEEEIADLRDRSARTLADFENYRKRVERERADERRFANVEIVGSFLTVIDNLERALTADGTAEDLKTGVELIYRQIKDLLRTSGVKRIKALGEEFDPTHHEAVSQYEDPGVSVPTVSEVLQAGYSMHEKLLRPAVVKVAMPVDSETAPGSNGS